MGRQSGVSARIQDPAVALNHRWAQAWVASLLLFGAHVGDGGEGTSRVGRAANLL